MFESKPQNSDYNIWMKLLLKVVSDNLGFFCPLTCSKTTFLETLLKMPITEEIWSPLCLKKAKKKLQLVQSNMQTSGRITWCCCALWILNTQATLYSNKV